MTTADEIIKRCNTGFTECLLKIIPDVASRRSIERDVAALGADDQLITRVTKLVNEIVQGFSDSSFASLKPVVCSGVDHVRAELNGSRDRVPVALIGCYVCIAEISANSDRGEL